jgi:hypothetical protein
MSKHFHDSPSKFEREFLRTIRFFHKFADNQLHITLQIHQILHEQSLMWKRKLGLVQMQCTLLVIILPYLINQAFQHLVRQVVEYNWCVGIGVDVLVEVDQRLDMHVQLLQDEVQSFGDG